MKNIYQFLSFGELYIFSALFLLPDCRIMIKRIEVRFLRLPMIALLIIVFAIGFNFYRVFLPGSINDFHKNSDDYALNIPGVIASHNYKVFPSRKQLIADPKDDVLSKLSFSPKSHFQSLQW